MTLGAARALPPPSDEAVPFWDASRDGRFVLPWCRPCDRVFWHPRAACPRCLSDDIEWREASGRGTVYAVSVQHNAALPELREYVPYAVALVDLEEGARMMANVIGCAAEDVFVGMPVTITWDPLPDGRRLPLFSAAGHAQPDRGEVR